jgi:D-lactate dehydrogenase
MAFNNVHISSHQAFLKDTALINIAKTTMENLECLEKGITCANEIS